MIQKSSIINVSYSTKALNLEIIKIKHFLMLLLLNESVLFPWYFFIHAVRVCVVCVLPPLINIQYNTCEHFQYNNTLYFNTINRFIKVL